MQELFLAGFLKTLLIIIVCYQVGKFLFKWWLRQKISSHAQQMNSSVNETEAEFRRHSEGKVSIKKEKSKSSTNAGSQDAGDYIDFEEID